MQLEDKTIPLTEDESDAIAEFGVSHKVISMTRADAGENGPVIVTTDDGAEWRVDGGRVEAV